MRYVNINGEAIPLGSNGGTITGVEIINNPSHAISPNKVYILAPYGINGEPQTIRTNGGQVAKILVGSKELWSQKSFAMGGIETIVSIENEMYMIHRFLESNVLNVYQDDLEIEYLVVAGGGAGGTSGGGAGHGRGGGGGGGLLQGSMILQPGIHEITVGLGGVASLTATQTDGKASSIGSYIIAAGGGGGGGGTFGINGRHGGSGGGGLPGTTGSIAYGGTHVAGQGSAGGIGTGNNSTPRGGGGGGGAGSVGESPGAVARGGDGGNGLTSTINGTEFWYAGGGGGGAGQGNIDAGRGLAGGGNGGQNDDNTSAPVFGLNAVANTGGGGGGAGGGTPAGTKGGDGGSGVVIIRYRIQSS